MLGEIQLNIPDLKMHFSRDWDSNQSGQGVHLHKQLNTLYEIAVEAEKRNDSISLDSIHLNE